MAASNYDMLDTMISINIVLFIVSVIVEKFTQLIRKYAPFPKVTSVIKKMFGIEDGLPPDRMRFWHHIKKKQTGNDDDQDNLVEREVNSLSFALGVLIAIAFRIDLFKMLASQDPRDVLMWSSKTHYSGLDIFLFFLSIPLTGFFLTFGSKFFHDLLDTLMQVKNLKRKLVDANTYNSDTIDQFDDYLKKSYNDIIDQAIQQNAAKFKDPAILYPPMHGKMFKDGVLTDCIEIHMSGSTKGQIPDQVQAKIESGKVIVIPVNTITDVDAPVILGGQGTAVASSLTPNYKGNICCRISRNSNPELMTCSHVFTGGQPINYFGEIEEVGAVVNDAESGNFNFSLLNELFDVALLTDAGDSFNYVIPPGTERQVTGADILTTPIRVVCRDGAINKGKITNPCLNNPLPIQWENGRTRAMSKLMILSNVGNANDPDSYRTLTQKGDSGACVYDDEGRPIGMVVAGNNRFSYAISMVDILKETEATIIT